jgi:hypothetical protein
MAPRLSDGAPRLQGAGCAVDSQALMAIDIRVFRWALVPLLLIVCVTVALWQLGVEADVPGVRDTPAHAQDHGGQARVRPPAADR